MRYISDFGFKKYIFLVSKILFGYLSVFGTENHSFRLRNIFHERFWGRPHQWPKTCFFSRLLFWSLLSNMLIFLHVCGHGDAACIWVCGCCKSSRKIQYLTVDHWFLQSFRIRHADKYLKTIWGSIQISIPQTTRSKRCTMWRTHSAQVISQAFLVLPAWLFCILSRSLLTESIESSSRHLIVSESGGGFVTDELTDFVEFWVDKRSRTRQ